MARKLALAMILGSLSLWLGCQSEATAPTPDTTAPTATILLLDEAQLSLQFELEFAAEDDDSGVASVELFVRTPDWAWASLGHYNQSPVTFLASVDGPHCFYAVAVDSAGNRSEAPPFAQAETIVPVPIIITDRRGEDFDITNAVLKYFMSENGWGHGIGRDTIRPINNPQFKCPGDVGYPASHLLTNVLGVSFGGQARAYPPGDFANREVVNDVVGGVHLSATY